MANKVYGLGKNSYEEVKASVRDRQRAGGTRVSDSSLMATALDSNVIIAYNADSTDIGRGRGVAITSPLRNPAESNMVSRFLGRKAVKVKRAFIDTTEENNYETPLAITLEPIRRGKVGRIVVSGPAYAYIDILETPAAIASAQSASGREGILAGRTAGLPGCRILASTGAAGLGWAVVDVGSYVSPYASMYRCQLKANLLSGTTSLLVNNLVAYDGIATTYDPLAEATATNFLSLSGDAGDAAVIRYSASDDRWDLLEVTC